MYIHIHVYINSRYFLSKITVDQSSWCCLEIGGKKLREHYYVLQDDRQVQNIPDPKKKSIDILYEESAK